MFRQTFFIPLFFFAFFLCSCQATFEKKNLYTQLLHFAQMGDPIALKKVIAKGVNINKRNKTGKTALMIASANGHSKAVHMLIESGAAINTTEKFEFIDLFTKKLHTGSLAFLRFCNTFADQNINNNEGLSVLPFVAIKIIASTAQFAFAGTNSKKSLPVNGNTALIAASEAGATEVVKTLLQKGADINIRRKDGNTALLVAARTGRNNIVKLLINHGAHIHAENNEGQNAYMIATDYANTKVARTLRQFGAKRKEDVPKSFAHSLGQTIASTAGTIFKIIHGGTEEGSY